MSPQVLVMFCNDNLQDAGSKLSGVCCGLSDVPSISQPLLEFRLLQNFGEKCAIFGQTRGDMLSFTPDPGNN